MLAEKLSGHLPQEIVVRGSRGCLLFPLATQLNDDAPPPAGPADPQRCAADFAPSSSKPSIGGMPHGRATPLTDVT